MKNPNGERMGPTGNCICPKCGYKQPHKRGVPCQEERCPKCNGKMLREGSDHHQKVEQAKAKRKEKAKTDK